jgi:polysaccharide export outer membrane protein
MTRNLLFLPVAWMCLVSTAWAQAPAPVPAPANSSVEAAAIARLAAAPGEYEIGPEDVLDISVWKNTELSRRVPVRPDGKISLPLVNDIQAAGLTPSQLREQLTKKLTEFLPTPEVAVIVSEVQSLKVTVMGAVKTPGRFMLKSPATVLECLALAQGLTEFSNSEKIVVLRQEGGATKRIPFNYRKVSTSSDQDNFFVKPGDVIVVP